MQLFWTNSAPPPNPSWLGRSWCSSGTTMTLKNEALNCSVICYAPKDRHFSKISSLKTRVCLTMGVSNTNSRLFWSDVLSRIGIEITTSIETLLANKNEKRVKQKVTEILPSQKLVRTKRLRESIKQEIDCEAVAKKEGKTYQSSCHLEIKSEKKIIFESLKKGRQINKDLPICKKTYKYHPVHCKILDILLLHRGVVKWTSSQPLIRKKQVSTWKI